MSCTKQTEALGNCVDSKTGWPLTEYYLDPHLFDKILASMSNGQECGVDSYQCRFPTSDARNELHTCCTSQHKKLLLRRSRPAAGTLASASESGNVEVNDRTLAKSNSLCSTNIANDSSTQYLLIAPSSADRCQLADYMLSLCKKRLSESNARLACDNVIEVPNERLPVWAASLLSTLLD